MKKKLLLQELANRLAPSCGWDKKDAEGFARAFFETIERGLLEDRFVKVKGFGTFKLVVVSERESVNVNTGERFQIGKHTKVSFTPDPALKELVNRPFAHFEAVDLYEETDIEELNRVDGGMAEDAAKAEEQGTEDAGNPQTGSAEAAPRPETGGNGKTIPVTRPDAEEVTLSGRERGGEGAEGAEENKQDDSKIDTEEKETDEGGVTEEDAATTGENVAGTSEETTSPEEAAHTPAESVQEESSESEAAEGETEIIDEPAAEAEIKVSSPTPISRHSERREENADAAEVTGAKATTGGAVSISYSEVPRPAGHNWWKTATLTICVLLLMALSYFAGYFQLLCPCSFFGYSTFPPVVVQPRTSPATASEPQRPSSVPTAGRPDQAKPAEAKRDTAAPPAKTTPKKETTAPKAAEPPQTRYHKVKVGDNLSVLSRRYYGSDKHIDFILRHNHLRDADNIPLGATLEFPPLPQQTR